MTGPESRRIGVRACLQACVTSLLIYLLVFPPGLIAGSIQVHDQWNHGTGKFSSSNWCLAGTNCTPEPYPNNNNGTGNTYTATIAATTAASDLVTFDNNVIHTGLTIDGLTLGSQTNSATTSTLTVNSNSLTLGTVNTSNASVLTIYNGGVLNVQDTNGNPGSVTLNLSAPGASASNGGQINVTDSGTLTLENTNGAGGIQSTFTNTGNISVVGTSILATLALNDGGHGNSFLLTGSGSLTLGGSSQVTGTFATESLTNDTNHTINVNNGATATIWQLAGFTNNGGINVGVGPSSVNPTSLTIDTTSTGTSGTFTNSSTGNISVSDGSTLTFQNYNGGTAIFTNNGLITLGQSAGATLQLNDGYAGTTFDLNGSGTLVALGSTAAIQGESGYESLINDTGHTINIGVDQLGNQTATNATISNLTGFTNNGNINIGGLPGSPVSGTPAVSSLTIDTTDGGFGGSFSNAYSANIFVADGSTLTLQNFNGATNPNNLTGGSTAVFNNDGTITLGQSGGASLRLNDGGYSTTFDLTDPINTGTLVMNGTSSISGVNGTESLTNDTFHWINVGVDANSNPTVTSNATISNLANFTNNGSINIGGTPSGVLSSASALTIDTTDGGIGGSFSNSSGASIFVADGSTLTFQNENGGTAIFTNNGVITLGQATGATLQLNDGGYGTTFDLNGTGTLIANGASAIAGVNGTESLINDAGHSINVGVDQDGYPTVTSNATISNLANFTNNGSINIGGTPLGGLGSASALTIDTADGGIGGSFSNSSGAGIFVADGSTLTLQNYNGGTAIFTNNGLITLGQSTGATLRLNDGEAGTTFDLNGSGAMVVLGRNAAIEGVTGAESLINDTNHTINVGVDPIGNLTATNATMSNLYGFTNNGTINIGGIPGIAPIGTPAASNLTIDTTNGGYGGTFSNSYGANINVADGSSLTFQNFNSLSSYNNYSGQKYAVFNNDGNITLGQSSGATLKLNDGGFGTVFDLTSQNYTGVLNMNGASSITGVNFTESLINDSGHTINVNNGSNSSIQNLASFTNNGNINVGAGGSFANLTIDTSAAAGAQAGFSNNGFIGVADGAQLTLQNTSGAGTAFFSNGSYIQIGNTTGASLALNSGFNNTAFDLFINSGDGSILMYGNSSIYGVSGNESLINDYGHYIVGYQGAGTISNLAGFTNNGGLAAEGGSLSVNAPLTNWNAATQTLTGGDYFGYGAGSTLQLSSLGSSTIQNLNNAAIALYQGGLITGDGTTDAIAGLTNITNSQVYLGSMGTPGGPAYTISPTGGTLTLSSTVILPQGPTSSFAVDESSNVLVAGNFVESGTGQNALTVSSGSTLTVSGFTASANSLTSITGASTLNITGANGFTNVSSGGVLSGGAYDIAGGSTLNYNGANINTIAANTSVTLDGFGSHILNGSGDALNGNLTEVDGTLRLLNGASLTLNSFNNVDSNTSSPTYGTLGYGTLEIGNNSSLSYTGAAISTIGSNASLTLDGNWSLSSTGNTDALSNSLTTVNGSLAVNNGAVLTLTQPSFTNVTSGGTLQYGNITVDGGSFTYNGAQINTIGSGASLTLGNGNTIYNPWSLSANPGTGAVDAVSSTLSLVSGTLTITDNGAFTATGAQGSFTVDTNGTLNLLNNSTLDLSGAASGTATTFGNLQVDPETGLNALTGGNYLISNYSTLNYSGANIAEIGADTSLTLDGTPQGGYGITNNGSDALSGSLTTINGTLTLQNYGSMTLTSSAVTNNGAVNVLNRGDLEFTGGYNNQGVTNVTGGSTLGFQNSYGGLVAINNDGNITLGQSTGPLEQSNGTAANSTGGTLLLNDGGTYSLFDLGSDNGSGTLTMNGASSISGVNGTESLINDYGHTINVSNGSTSSIQNLVYLENDGVINVGNQPLGISQHPVTLGQSFVPPTPTASLTIDTTAAGGTVGFSNTFDGPTGGTINVADGAALILQNTSGTGTAEFNNDGAINIGSSTGGYLGLNSAGKDTGFDISSQYGSGAINLAGNSIIYGVSGKETLINDSGHAINVLNGSSATIQNLASVQNYSYISVGSGGQFANLTIDTTSAGSSATAFSNNGTIQVADGAQLTLQNTSGAGTAFFNNNGNIVLGYSSGASLVLNSGGNNTAFNLYGNYGVVSLTGNSSIYGESGNESLINGNGHLIVDQYLISSSCFESCPTIQSTSTISNLASITNNGTLSVYGQQGDSPSLTTLLVAPTLTNWNNNTQTLTGGSYNATSGTLELSSLGSNTIQNLNSAGISLTSGGLITGDGTTDAVAGLTNATNSQIYLGGMGTPGGTPYTISPTGGTFTLSSTQSVPQGPTSSFQADNSSNVLVAGNFVETGTGQNALTVSNGSTLTVSGFTGSANSLTSITGASTLNITGANGFTNVSSGGVLSGGAYDIAGGSTLSYTGANISTIGANTSLTLDGSTSYILNGGNDAVANSLTEVDGTLRLLNGASLALSAFNNVQSNNSLTQGLHSSVNASGGTLEYGTLEIGKGSTLTYNGPVISTIAGPASLTLDGSGELVSAGNGDAIANSLTTVYGTLNVNNGAALTLTQPTFTNVTDQTSPIGAGVLQYGNIGVDGGSLTYNGAQINTIASGASLTLGNGNTIYNPWSLMANNGTTAVDAVSSSLKTVNGTLTITDNGYFAATGAQGSFTVGANGSLNITNGGYLDLSGTAPGTTPMNFTNVSSTGVLSGGSYFIGSDSALAYNGPSNINTIAAGTSLTIDNSRYGATGSIQNFNYTLNSFGTDALANSLTLNQGNLAIQNNAYMTFNAGAFTNDTTGSLSLTNGSSLAIQGAYINNGTTITSGGGNTFYATGLTNNGSLTIGAGDTADVRGGTFTNLSTANSPVTEALLNTLNGGNYHVSGLLQFDANSGMIQAVGQNTSITLDAANGGVAQILSGNSNAFAQLSENDGTVALKNGATLTTTAATGTLTNNGTLSTGGVGDSGNNSVNVTGNVFNTSAGIVNLSSQGDQMTASGNFTNDGGSVTVGTGATLTVNGNYTQDLGGGTTNISGTLAAGIFNLEAGDLTGGGTLEANLDQTGGTLNPGDPQTLTITGNYTLAADAGLDFDLAGTGSGQYDQVIVDGSLSIDPNAELQITLDSGFIPTNNTVFSDALSWQVGGAPGCTVVQQVGCVVLSNNDWSLGLLFSLVTDPVVTDQLDLVVTSESSPATPEPGTLPLLLGALLIGGGITWQVRRRRAVSVK